MLSDALKFIFTRNYVHNIRLECVDRAIRQAKALEQNNFSCTTRECLGLVLLIRSLVSFPMFDNVNNELMQNTFPVLVSKNLALLASDQKQHQEGQLCELFSELYLFFFKRTDLHTNQTLKQMFWSDCTDKLVVVTLSSTLRLLDGIHVEQPSSSQISIIKTLTNTLSLTELILRSRLSNPEIDTLSSQLLPITPLLLQSITSLSTNFPHIS